MTDLRYPIGHFEHTGDVTPADRERWIDDIEALPEALRQAVDGISEAALDTPYRPDGWTLRQVIHHIPESHLNAYVRVKWTLTEEEPTIKAYNEAAWSELPDVGIVPIGISVDLLTSLHARWTMLLRTLSDAEWNRTFIHPETGLQRLDLTIGSYAWHGRHHLAHITTTLGQMG